MATNDSDLERKWSRSSQWLGEPVVVLPLEMNARAYRNANLKTTRAKDFCIEAG